MDSRELITCIMCKTTHGYTEQEYLFHQFNNGLWHQCYPLISLSYAFKCCCNHRFAHNRCLKTRKICPLCGKWNSYPQIVVDTETGKSWDFVLKHFRNKPKNIKWLRWWIYAGIATLAMMLLLCWMDIIKDHDKTSSYIAVLAICFVFSTFIPATILEYAKKNWLME
jgi:hypothetical protein